MAMLDIVEKLNKIKDFSFSVAHFNHKLRSESDKEERFLKEYCKQRGIPFYSESSKIDLRSVKGKSIEEACRDERYSFFKKLINENKFNKIFTAHHLNDQAETILMRLVRGTGPEGITGIKEKSKFENIDLVRPFLSIPKVDLRKYCDTYNIPYFEDVSNNDVFYSRNRIRNQIVPELEKINSGAQKNIVSFSRILEDEYNIIRSIVNNLANKYLTIEKDKIEIEKEVFLDFNYILKEENLDYLPENSKLYLQKELIRKALKKSIKDFEQKHIDYILDFFKSNTSGRIDLPNDLIASINSGKYSIINKKKLNNNFGSYKLGNIKKKEKTFYFPKEGRKLSISSKINNDVDRNNKVVFNQEELPNDLTLRKRENGDKLKINGMTKKLSRFFIDKKVSSLKRDSIPILTSDESILWIPNLFKKESEPDATTEGEIVLIELSSIGD